MIRLVASDLDGTLLLHKAQSLPEEIFSLIRQLEELGIMFVAASGRQYPNMTKLFAPVASEISYISENGALAVDHGEVLYQDSFDRELANEIISAISKMTLRRFFVFFFFISKILQNKSMVGLPAYLKAGICRPQ